MNPLTIKTFEDLHKSNLSPVEFASRALAGEFDHIIEPGSVQVCIDEFGQFVSFNPRRTVPTEAEAESDGNFHALFAD